MPLPLSGLILMLALLLWWRSRRRLAMVVASVAVSMIYLLSLPPVARAIVQPLEFAYPKYDGTPVEYIVVLGGYHRSDVRIPLSSLLSQTSLMRLSEGIAVWRQNPRSTLLLSGYGGDDEVSNAEAMAQVARAQGVPETAIRIASKPRDTGSEARAWAPVVGDSAFALVSSASHLPRAMFLFQQQGMNPIPAPTAYNSAGTMTMNWRVLVPAASSLLLVERAWHEYLGIAWARLNS